MKVHAYDKTIKAIFSPTSTKYIVPRFQREYSWDHEDVVELWNDILSNLKKVNGEYVFNEYFIGSLVLVGDEEKEKSGASDEFLIVDGQQRLTTLTIMMSALVETFKNEKEEGIALGLYRLIEGRDMDDKPIYRLINESPKPFFQKSIQNYIKAPEKATTEEELRLFGAYNTILEKIEQIRLKSKDRTEFINELKAIRDQILYLKTIFITVDNEIDAYTIFETLNARGKNLTTIDLVKNYLFKALRYEHPDDDAKTKWKKMKENLISRRNLIKLETFFRHYWISKYEFSRDRDLYKSLTKRVQLNTINPEENKARALAFLEDMERESKNYLIVSNPLETDWRGQDEKPIYKSLSAIELFGVSQIHTLLIALIYQYKNGKIGINDFIDALQYLENIHFIFVISSSRPSQLERKYSKFARAIRSCSTKNESKKVIAEMKLDFNSRLPSISSFADGFNKLWFTNEKDDNKKIIQYIFTKWENYLQKTNELSIYQMYLEHIESQKSTRFKNIGKMGNLLPLSSKINNDADIKLYKDKIIEYKKSKLEVVKEFIMTYEAQDDWIDSDIDKRTKEMAEVAYSTIWKV